MQNNIKKLELPSSISVLEFCPYECIHSLLVIGTTTSISIYALKIEIFEADHERLLTYKLLKDILYNGNYISCLSWSKDTFYMGSPDSLVKFAYACSRDGLKILETNLTNRVEIKTLMGHSDFINDIAYNPENGDILASVSDDLTCRLWQGEGKLAKIYLTSPGMSVRWHTDDPGKLMVAEKCGIIRIYNAYDYEAIFSLECPVSPLFSADWCPRASLQIASVSDLGWYLWDTSITSRPMGSSYSHKESAYYIRFSNCEKSYIATRGRSGEIIVYDNDNKKEVLNLKIGLGDFRTLSWHNRRSILVASENRNVWFFDMEMNIELEEATEKM